MKGFSKLILGFFALVLITFFVTRQCSGPNGKLSQGKQKQYEQETSTLVLPVDIDIASFESMFNQQLDQKEWFYEQNNIKVNRNLSISFRVKKEGAAQLYPQDNQINLQIPLFIDIHPKLNSSLSLGLGRNMNLQARVLLKSKAAVSINEDWELVTDAITDYEVTESPKLNIAGININFDEQLVNSLELGKKEINEQIESQIKAAIDTKAIANEIFEQLKTPYPIESDAFKAWATIRPDTVVVTNLKASAPGTMQTTIVAPVQVNISTKKQETFTNNKLPKARPTTSFTNKNSQFLFPLQLDAQSLTTMLNQQEEQTIQIPQFGEVTLRNYKVNIENNQLHFTTDFTNEQAKGKLELTGKPTFDASNQSIGVQIQSVKSKSNNASIDRIINTAARSGALRNAIQQRFAYSIKNDIADINYAITQQLQSTNFNDFVQMKGYVDNIKINDVFITDNTILLDTEANVNTSVVVKAK